MFIRALCYAGILATAMSTAAVSNDYGTATAQAPATSLHSRQVAKLRLSPELKIMWRHEEHARLKEMPKEQRRGWLKKEWAAMSPSQRDRKVAELQTKWNALPPDLQKVMLQKRLQKRAARREQRAGSAATNGAANLH